ncbi:MAG: SCO family protein [Kiritimatiellae bacterium]|nr:SCO family protein [Kiritimatiellia bacterium]
MKIQIVLIICAALSLPLYAHAAACCATDDVEGVALSELPDESLYQLDSTWTNAEGAPIHLSDLRGPHRIVAMFYSTCTHVCPLIVSNMKRIEREVPADANIEFTLFSLDPERDTPKALREFAQRQKITAPNWKVLAASQDSVRELSAVLGVNYRTEADGEIAHSTQITLLDHDGRIVAQLAKMDDDPAPIIAALQSAHEH